MLNLSIEPLSILTERPVSKALNRGLCVPVIDKSSRSANTSSGGKRIGVKSGMDARKWWVGQKMFYPSILGRDAGKWWVRQKMFYSSILGRRFCFKVGYLEERVVYLLTGY